MIPALRRAAAALLAAVAVLAGVALGAEVADAADREVVVAPGGNLAYDPAELTVAVGDRVTFRWDADDHSVSELAPTDPDNPIESHPDCEGFLGVSNPDCGQSGDTYRWVAKTPGRYEYTCRVHPTTMAGTIVVEGGSASESPSEEPSTSESPSEEPSASASPSEEPSTSESPSEEPSASASPSQEPSASPSPTETPSATATPSPSPSPEPVPEAPSVEPVPSPLPSVDVPEPTFEAFPAADVPAPSESDDEVAGEVAVGADDGDDNRTIWAVVGGLGVLSTIGAIGHTILHSEAWGA